ncbi:hypothetical protein HA402_013464 [Bradysia odoriphaga]|nr:hypothetical protein HA402_013464 [Bradysia odoriphaga]
MLEYFKSEQGSEAMATTTPVDYTIDPFSDTYDPITASATTSAAVVTNLDSNTLGYSAIDVVPYNTQADIDDLGQTVSVPPPAPPLPVPIVPGHPLPPSNTPASVPAAVLDNDIMQLMEQIRALYSINSSDQVKTALLLEPEVAVSDVVVLHRARNHIPFQIPSQLNVYHRRHHPLNIKLMTLPRRPVNIDLNRSANTLMQGLVMMMMNGLDDGNGLVFAEYGEVTVAA